MGVLWGLGVSLAEYGIPTAYSRRFVSDISTYSYRIFINLSVHCKIIIQRSYNSLISPNHNIAVSNRDPMALNENWYKYSLKHADLSLFVGNFRKDIEVLDLQLGRLNDFPERLAAYILSDEECNAQIVEQAIR